MPDTGWVRPTVEQLAEAYLERLRRGERPELAEYLEKYAELAEENGEVFPAMAVLEEFGPGRDFADSEPRAAIGAPQQLGDFRILREVGHGGMGVVYEAEQLSLSRRVALKVLPFQVSSDSGYLERFRREAKAAAGLHHSNIVPVFGVGEEDGVHLLRHAIY